MAAVLFALSIILPGSTPSNQVQASPIIPAMLLQTIGEAENQCRIAEQNCMINSDRCKANFNNAINRQNQCKARKDREYRACYDKVYRTARPGINSPNSQRLVEWRDKNAKRQCQNLKDTRNSCPRPKDNCYSRGYCIQQYQSCSSNAYLIEQSNNQRQIPQPPQPTERSTPPPAPRSTTIRPSRPVSGLPWNDRRPYVYRVEIENTCKHPIKAAYGILDENGVRSHGWEVLNRGRNIIDFPAKQARVKIYLQRGELASVRARGKLTIYEHKGGSPFYLADNRDFDLNYDLIATTTPPKPGYRISQFATLAQGFGKSAKRYKIIKCKTKR